MADKNESTADDYPNSEATEQAKSFRSDTDFTTGVVPTYNNGDAVWIYRKRQKKWVEAEVTDNRQVLNDGYYLVTLKDGLQVEGHNQTLAPRKCASSARVRT